MSDLIHYGLVAGIWWSIFCRARKMHPDTPTRLKLQNGIVLLLSGASMPLFGFSDWAAQLLAAAMFGYLVVDSRRWASGIPIGCAIELSNKRLREVAGGRDSR